MEAIPGDLQKLPSMRWVGCLICRSTVAWLSSLADDLQGGELVHQRNALFQAEPKRHLNRGKPHLC